MNTNTGLAAMIVNKKYTLNDASQLVNKIAEQKIGKNNTTKAYNNLVNKLEQIAELRSTPHRQKMVEMFNYMGDIFNGPKGEESVLQGQGLKILTQSQMLSRLPISLAPLKAANISVKLKNKIRQILYSLHRSKRPTKQLHNNLINAIYKNGNNLYKH